MPQLLKDENCRISLRIQPSKKALLRRAAALKQRNLTEFVIETAVAAAARTIADSERTVLSERDSLLVLDALENPARPNKRLLRAARELSAAR